MATITIDVLDTSLTTTGAGPIQSAYDVSYDEPLSMCGFFSFSVPARDQRAALLTVQQSIVRIYEDDTAVFLGIVEAKERSINAGASVFRISGRSYLAQLADSTVAFLGISSGGAGVTTGPASVLSVTSPTGMSSGWTLDSTNGASVTVTSIYAQFRGETRLAALVKIAEKIGEAFIYRPHLAGSGDKKVIWLTSYADSGVRAIQGGGEAVALEGNDAVCLIESLTELEDGAELVNRLIPYGGGDDIQNSALTLAASTYSVVGTGGQPDAMVVYNTNNHVDYTYSISTLGYRYREGVVQFQDIAPISNTDADQQSAANMLAVAGMRYLRRYGIPHKFYELEVFKLPSTVYAGKTLRVIYYEEDTDGTVLHDINTDLYILNVATSYGNDGSKSHKLTVATTDRFPASDTETVATRIEKAQVYGAYPQLGPSIDTLSFAEPFDDTTTARLDFWLGAEIAQVQQVLLRFKIDPLRSTVESLAGSSTTTDSGGSSTPTSSSADPTHFHLIHVSDGTGTYAVTADYGAGAVNLFAPHGGGSSVEFSTDSQAGGEMSHSHSVTIAGHTHTLTPNISANYGIFEDSGGTVIDDSTLANLKTEITMSVNGTNRTSSIVDASVSGWYELDVTAWVSSATTFRPTSAAHYITVIAANSGDRGRITGQLQIRALVQSVAYS